MSRTAKEAFGGLTEREREVAALIGQGKASREIAEILVVNTRTIEKHIENMLSKLGFISRAQIAVWASEKGLGQKEQSQLSADQGYDNTSRASRTYRGGPLRTSQTLLYRSSAIRYVSLKLILTEIFVSCPRFSS